MLRNERGVALILVISVIAMLTALAVDFSINGQIQYRLALGERSRLQAEYLARSGLNFVRLELAKERALKQTLSQLAPGVFDPKVPLCKQFPFSTEMLRAFFAVAAAGGAGGEAGGAAPSPEAGGEGGAVAPPEAGGGTQVVTAFDTAAAESFLERLGGDFEGLCEDESAKFNLNVFAGLKPDEQTLGGFNLYDRQKNTFVHFLSLRSVATLFSAEEGEAKAKIEVAVRNLADWVDANDQVNTRPGVQGGSELGEYGEREADFQIRNARMVTLDEAYLVAGVSDEWFTPLRPYLTVYGADKINICTADPLVIEALIVGYAANNQRIPQISPENRELIEKVVAQVATDCMEPSPSAGKITQDVEALLMTGGSAVMTAQPLAGETAPEAAAATAGGGFADLITLESKVFRLVGTGSIPVTKDRSVSARVELVLDMKEDDPKQWKVLYWRQD